MRNRIWLVAGIAGAALLPHSTAAAQAYQQTSAYRLGGDGGWDYLTFDPVGHRLFIARQDRIMVVDPATGSLLHEIRGIAGAHGVALDEADGHGFVTGGRDGSVTMFDLKSYAVLAHTAVAEDADAILFDPFSRKVLSFNGDAHSVTAVDPVSGAKLIEVDLGAKPEFAVSTGDGKLYVNLEDASEVAEIDPTAMKVTRRWSIAPCENPTGLAIDRAHHRLFSGCRNGKMGISDADRGTLITTLPIGSGVDGCGFDPELRVASCSGGGDGTITTVREESPSEFKVIGTTATRRGARTMTIDEATHRLFTVSADFGPALAPTASRPRPRPPVLPDTFVLLVYRWSGR